MAASWPIIDLTVTEDGTRDVAQKLTLRILAAPKVELIPYELVQGSLGDSSGSRLEVICPPCELAHPFIPLEGTLQVGLVYPVDDGLSVYRLDQIHLKDLLPDVAYSITGSGSYEEGGDAEMLKQGRLTLAVGSYILLELRGGPVSVHPGQAFPVVDLEVEETRKNTLWYRLHLVARPTKGVTFRRGDANSDGALDIADPIAVLGRLFLGGEPLRCEDAADANDDGSLDVSDPIGLLIYLFSGGIPLPPPFRSCGQDPTPGAPGCAAGC